MKSDINITLTLNESRMPEKIEWIATDSDMNEMKESKALMLSFWDAEEKETLGIDLWTEKNDGRRNEYVRFFSLY